MQVYDRILWLNNWRSFYWAIESERFQISSLRSQASSSADIGTALFPFVQDSPGVPVQEEQLDALIGCLFAGGAWPWSCDYTKIATTSQELSAIPTLVHLQLMCYRIRIINELFVSFFAFNTVFSLVWTRSIFSKVIIASLEAYCIGLKELFGVCLYSNLFSQSSETKMLMNYYCCSLIYSYDPS